MVTSLAAGRLGWVSDNLLSEDELLELEGVAKVQVGMTTEVVMGVTLDAVVNNDAILDDVVLVGGAFVLEGMSTLEEMTGCILATVVMMGGVADTETVRVVTSIVLEFIAAEVVCVVDGASLFQKLSSSSVLVTSCEIDNCSPGDDTPQHKDDCYSKLIKLVINVTL